MEEQTPEKLVEYKEEFIIVPRLMLATFVCDDDGNELEFDDYKEKGTCIKVVTEEVLQEVAVREHRLYEEQSKKFYWKNSDPILYSHEGKFLNGTRDNNGTIVDITREEIALDKVKGLLSNMIIKDVNGVVTNPSDRIRFVLPDNNNLTQHNDTQYNGATVKYDTNIIANSKIENDKSYTNSTIYDHRSFAKAREIPTSTTTPKELEVVTGTGAARFTIMRVSDSFAMTDKHVEDPRVEIGTIDNRRKMMIYETYSNRTPSKIYKVTPEDGLDKGILDIITDPKLSYYKNLKKLMISENTRPGELQYFTSRNYSIKEETYQKMFDRFKDVSIENMLLEVIFPSKELELNNLKLFNCKIRSNNGIITVNNKLELDNVTITGDNKVFKSTTFKCKDSVTIPSLNFINVGRLNIICSEKDKNCDISNVVVKCSSNEVVRKTRVSNILLYIDGFLETNITSFKKEKDFDLNNVILLRVMNSNKVSITEFDRGNTPHKSVIIHLDNVQEVNISKYINDTMEVKDINKNIFITNMKVGKINISDSKVNGNELLNISSSEVGEIVIKECVFLLNKFIRGINSLDIPVIKIDDSTFTLYDKFNMTYDDVTFSNCIINIKNSESSIISKNKVTFNDSTIGSDKLHIGFTESGKILFNSSNILIKELNIDNTIGTNNICEFTQTKIESDILFISNINTISNKYSFYNIKNIRFDKIGILKSMETELYAPIIKSFIMTNIVSIPKVDFVIAGGEVIDIVTENCKGIISYSIRENNTLINRKSVSCKIVEIYNQNDKDITLRVNSTNCKNSAYIVDKVTNILVDPMSIDYRKFTKIDPIVFSESIINSVDIDTIYYGKV